MTDNDNHDQLVALDEQLASPVKSVKTEDGMEIQYKSTSEILESKQAIIRERQHYRRKKVRVLSIGN